jgi:hypothetical protein
MLTNTGRWEVSGKGWVNVGLLTLAVAGLHLASAGRYDLFRNELYFIVCGRHPAFGYVDQPPLVPLLAAATQMTGHSVWLARLPAVLAAAALVPLTAALARLFNPTPAAIWLAAGAAALSPALAALTSTLTTSTFEPLTWTATAYCLARMVVKRDARWLIAAGAVAGVSMQFKYGVMLWLIGLGAGLLLTPERRWLATRACGWGVLIGVLIAAPSLIWQAQHQWPFLAVMWHQHEAHADLTGHLLQFELRQMVDMNLMLAPLWLIGVVAPWTLPALKPARFLSVALLITSAVVLFAQGKAYYLFPVYPSLCAVGAAATGRLRPWLIAVWLLLIIAAFLPLLPFSLPLLSPDALTRYMDRSGLRPRPVETAGIGAPLTQVFSDEMGWEGLEQQVAHVYQSLPPAEQQRATILAFNYGDAAAIDFYGQQDHLPPVVSGSNQYYLWGPRGADGGTVIMVNTSAERWVHRCDTLQVAATFGAPYAMPYEQDRPILLCRGLHFDLTHAWDRFQRYQ